MIPYTPKQYLIAVASKDAPWWPVIRFVSPAMPDSNSCSGRSDGECGSGEARNWRDGRHTSKNIKKMQDDTYLSMRVRYEMQGTMPAVTNL